jgi:peptidoglycan L-alanyl-D-glutamate endopeptidase CwlK
MAFKFSSRSQKVLGELHPQLQIICKEAIKVVDFTLLDAQRGRAEQERAFRAGHSKAHFGDSAHNYVPAVAFDLVPSPLSWDANKFKPIAKVIGYYDARQGDGRGLALKLKIPLRWGADWDMDGDWNDERFLDWGHWELDPWRTYAKLGKLIKG